MQKRIKGAKLREERKLLRKEINDELEKLQVGRKIEQFELLLGDRVSQCRELIQKVLAYLSKGDRRTAVVYINKAIDCLQEIQIASAQMRKLEKKLEQLIKYEYFLTKKETKLTKKEAA